MTLSQHLRTLCLLAATLLQGMLGPLFAQNPNLTGGEARGLVAASGTSVTNCENVWITRLTVCEECVDENGSGFSGANNGTMSEAPVCSENASVVENGRLTHHHFAEEYAVGMSEGNCATCVSGGDAQNSLATLLLRRIHRYRDITVSQASFGPGVYLNYDYSLQLYEMENGVAVADVFDPSDLYSRRLTDGEGTDAQDGVFLDAQTQLYCRLELYDSNGNLTTNIQQGDSAVLYTWDGRKNFFDIFALDSAGYMLGGRLTGTEDRNGYGITLQYDTSWTAQQLAESPERQWRLKSITDAYGRTALIDYRPQQISGHWVISTITTPNSETISYNYANGKLSSVNYPDQTNSSFAYNYDAPTNTLKVDYADVGAKGIHRRKSTYLTTNASMLDDFVLNASANLVRLIDINTPIGEPTYLSTPEYRYEGGGKLKVRKEGTFFQSPNWNFQPNTNFTNVGSEQNYQRYYFQSSRERLRGKPRYIREKRGYLTAYEYDSAGYVTRITYSDGPNGTTNGGSTEEFSYNQFQQVTRYKDRIDRVSLTYYDSLGNRRVLRTGWRFNGTTDVPVPADSALYRWEYYPGSSPHKGLLRLAYDALGHATEYHYDSSHYLIRIVEPADIPNGPRPEIRYSYDSIGRVDTTWDQVGRFTVNHYDERDRVIRLDYSDGSHEATRYGTGTFANLMVSHRDRNGNVSSYSYDDAGRLIQEIAADSTLDAFGQLIATDVNTKRIRTCTYLPGTQLLASCTTNGETVNYIYDYRHRLIGTEQQARQGLLLQSSQTYKDNQLFASADAYGRETWQAYRPTDGHLLREVRATVPEFSTSNPLSVTRNFNPNANRLVTSYTVDAAGQQLRITDARGIADSMVYDSRGRLTDLYEALGTPDQARTETVYDMQSNVIRTRHPRTFAEADSFVTTSTYNGRNLLQSRTEATGYPEAATDSFFYAPDQRRTLQIDARGKAWRTLWHNCCGRYQGSEDPTGAGDISNTDYYGNVTHTATIADFSVDTNYHAPVTELNETTTRYDARHRPTAHTAWLIPLPSVDPNDVPIAGEGIYAHTDGLTTRWLYDENLLDGIGLDNSSQHPHIAALLTQLQLDGISFSAGSDGSAVLEINPAGEVAAQIMDGLGRTVMTAVIDSASSLPLTWTTTLHDSTEFIPGIGTLLKTIRIDALDHRTAVYTDGAGRSLRLRDAADQWHLFTYDANGNRLSDRDPNGVGQDCRYDFRDRPTRCTDTEGDRITSIWDVQSNPVVTIDAKGRRDSSAYDRRNRRTAYTDRISGTTVWTYDLNSNIVHILDAEGNGTFYGYDPRNLLARDSFADGGRRLYVHDGARRRIRFADQQDDYVIYRYDRANRLHREEFRASGVPETAPPTDSDSLGFDRASRLIYAEKGRYDNVCRISYDAVGRKRSEVLEIFGQSYSITSEYDADNRRTRIVYPDQTEVRRGYTARNQLADVRLDGDTVAVMAYDPGMRDTLCRYGNGLQTRKRYDRQDDLVSRIEVPGRPGLSFTYSYDANKNLTGETTGGPMAGYSFTVPAYDDEDRLTSWKRNNGDAQTWDLSQVGNWNSTVNNGIPDNRSHNGVHELTGSVAGAFAYDPKGNQLSGAGRMYAWDFENQLATADYVGPNTAAYFYDALGRRVARVLGTDTTVFVCDGSQVVTEYGAGNAVQRAFVYGSYVDAPLVLRNSAAVVHYYHRNRQYSVTGLTDSLGNVVERYAYSAYGEPVFLDATGAVAGGSVVGNPYLFTGRRWDVETGNYYFRARYYSAVQGRFLGRDPLGYVDGMGLYGGYFAERFGLDPMGYGEGWIPDWLQGKEGLIPDWLQGREGWIPDALQGHPVEGVYEYIEKQPIKELLGFSISALSNSPEIVLTGELLELVKKDPTILAHEKGIKEKVVNEIMKYRKPKTKKMITKTIILHHNSDLEFGGKRADGNMMDQLKGFWKKEYRATWKVGLNPLTWMIRHTAGNAHIEVKLKYNCEGYDARYQADHWFEDKLDLRPHNHDKNDFSALLNAKENAYDAATVLLGTVYHDLLKRRDDLKVKAKWQSTNKVSGKW